jgi:hypothetical protein
MEYTYLKTRYCARGSCVLDVLTLSPFKIASPLAENAEKTGRNFRAKVQVSSGLMGRIKGRAATASSTVQVALVVCCFDFGRCRLFGCLCAHIGRCTAGVWVICVPVLAAARKCFFFVLLCTASAGLFKVHGMKLARSRHV